MAEDQISVLAWYHKPFGRRVMSSEPPYFVISPEADPEDGAALRRHELARRAGLD
jgi:hypothetical protein